MYMWCPDVGGREFCGKGMGSPCVSKRVPPPTKWEYKPGAVCSQALIIFHLSKCVELLLLLLLNIIVS